MSENKDAVRDQIAKDIKNYLARGKVIKKYRYHTAPTKGVKELALEGK